MGKGIILRVLENTILSPQVFDTLERLLPGYKVEYFKEQPDYRKSIARRIDSLHDAFSFILKAYPLDPKHTSLTVATLSTYAAECKASCDLEKLTLEELHLELERFTAKLVEAIAIAWKWPKGKAVKEAIASLNEAEQYVLMSRGRSDIATIMPIEMDSETKYVLQYDESLSPVYEQWLTELKQLKEYNFPKTPAWFKNLPPYQQAYYCNLNLSSVDPKKALQHFNTFFGNWGDIAKRSLNLTTELNQIHTNSPPYPSWFNELSPAQQAMIRVLSATPHEIKSSLKEFKKFMVEQARNDQYASTLSLVPKLPQWYWVLSEKQQYFLEYALKNAEKVEDVVSYLSSRHRTLPAPANYGAHSLYLIDGEGKETLFYDKRYRSSHVASRDSLKLPEDVQQRHVDSNLVKVMEFAKPQQPLLLQTLISPIHAVDYIPTVVTDFLPELPPDLELYKIAREAVTRSKRRHEIFQHNHPFNIAKRYYYTQATDTDSDFLLKTAQKYASSKPGLQALIDDYKAVLESPLGSATFWDYDGRELFLSSLEELIILNMGGYSYGSCVSGKDRKAVELLHTDAMILYKAKYGNWPKFGIPKEKQERVNFINIVVDLYISRHQHELAGQNAPGSEGIKTPDWYWPNDIAEAINERLGTEKALAYDDRLATDNEVKNISKDLRSFFLPENELHCLLIAKQLGEKMCTMLYDVLSALINEERRFQKSSKDSWKLRWFSDKDVSSTPTGILNIREVMHDENSGNDNVLRIGKIFAAVLNRPESDSSRTTATNSVYDRIRKLLQPLSSESTLQTLAEEAILEWSSLFESSKRENSGLVYV
ncbi:TPA: oxidoreductase [Legionella pneumophila]|uniref:oxidoreductase n=1 Tax=Legionella pneumophila TaxID=446 RepID=UPI001374B53B|nr:oxidoreductase [Legionella pneumophila]HAT9115278.1 oxidoreductase [Legionella pneumophila subsp. pneumophila]MDW8899601.1 oxidoreductase [Legionella pneumophila]MDW8907557.1 oxidoreductase [Legionella pneumophila]HAT1793418.1 oxidoreductase [Legionella pneumophila]HAT1848314.1 oxidoreductase [Legionella pneumophila]